MTSPENCPTCGTTLGPLHADALRRCDACQKPNPRGFRYCGFCAAPMQTADERAALAGVVAPAGGWPSLSRELVQLRFFMERGELDEAFELLSVLHERYPGHPALTEFDREPPGRNPRPDTAVHRVVDSVLASSSSLSATLPRRAAPQWKAEAPGQPSSEPRTATRAHATVPLGAGTGASVNKRVHGAKAPEVGSARAQTDKHLGAVPLAEPDAGASLSQPEPGVPRSGPDAVTEPLPSPDAITKPEPIPPALAAAIAASEVASKAAPAPGMTVAVPTLQPPAPYGGEGAGDKAARKRALKTRKRSGRQAILEGSGEGTGRKRRGRRFGQHVLGRLGGNDESGR